MKKYLLIILVPFTLLSLSGFLASKKFPFNDKKNVSLRNFNLNTDRYATTYKKTNFKRSRNNKNTRQQLMQKLSHLPLLFVKNMGQWRKEVLYMAVAEETKVGFRKNGVTFFSLREVEEHDEDDPEEEDGGEEHEEELHESMVWNINFKGMNASTRIIGEAETPGVISYLLGKDSTKWIRNTPQCRLINYQDIYDHIDLHYYGTENKKLEYDYIVKPGGNISDIQMELEGAGDLKVNQQGELVITTPWGKVAEARPYSYQMIDGVKKEVDVRYEILDDHTFGFKAYANYNRNYDLVIDPRQLVWSTYINGTASVHYVYDMAIDANGNCYMGGMTESGFDITAGVVQSTFAGGATDNFVFKINRLGTALVYCTYVGGSNDDRGFGLAASTGGNVYITGQTESTDYPTTAGAISTTHNGGTLDAFVTALNTAGNGFIYSTYFGGVNDDRGEGITVNSSNEAFVTGYGAKVQTTAGVVRTAAVASGRDAFVLKLTAAGGNALCTLLGANSINEVGHAVAVSATGEIYVTGYTPGASFSTAGYDNTPNGGSDAFVVKLDAAATTILYSTYLGGTGEDIGWGIAVRNNEAYIMGVTAGGGFPTTGGAVQTAYGGGPHDFFITKLNTAGTGLVYSTFIGGSSDEYGSPGDWNGSDIVVNNNGEAYISGTTLSTNNPMGPIGYDLSANGLDEGFIALLSSNGQNILCSTYLGGAANDYKKISIALRTGGAQDTLYGSLTTHSRSPFNSTPGTFPIAQTQGTVYGQQHMNGSGDEPVVFKMYSCMVPLPVELISFQGISKDGYNLLQWTTATEKNNDHFAIERSTDGINFTAIGVVQGAGNSNAFLHYSYQDIKISDDIVYYRLKQVDNDGATTCSDIIAINESRANGTLSLDITSPVTDELKCTVCCLQKGEAKIEILDLKGNIVVQAIAQIHSGYNHLTVNTGNLSQGLYILKFSSDDGNAKSRFVKQ